jgi:hypothetical protein
VLSNPAPDLARETSELLKWDVLEFIYEGVRGGGWFGDRVRIAVVEQRIFDQAHRWIGQVRQQSPGRKSTFEGGEHHLRRIHAGIYDAHEARVLEFVRDGGGKILEVYGSGRPIGTLVVKRLGSATLYNRWDQPIGTITLERRRWSSLDFAIEDATGTEVGWIADPIAHARRIDIDVRRRRKWFESFETVPDPERHFLVIAGQVRLDLRLMMLAASAGVHLVLSGWAQEGD